MLILVGVQTRCPVFRFSGHNLTPDVLHKCRQSMQRTWPKLSTLTLDPFILSNWKQAHIRVHSKIVAWKITFYGINLAVRVLFWVSCFMVECVPTGSNFDKSLWNHAWMFSGSWSTGARKIELRIWILRITVRQTIIIDVLIVCVQEAGRQVSFLSFWPLITDSTVIGPKSFPQATPWATYGWYLWQEHSYASKTVIRSGYTVPKNY